MDLSEANDAKYSVVAENLCKSYGSARAVKNVSFKIKAGEILGFLGPNGAGKSTTMRILSGLMPATSGRAYVCGVSVANNPALACSKIGYMPENNPLPEDVRIAEYLRYRAGIKGLRGAELKRRVDEVLDVCGLARATSRKIIGNLSKGYRQRVGIADTLLGNPEVVIMDEPTIGLDPHQILTIRELIGSLRGKMSVVISSHILSEIELVCDRALIINGGRVVASGSPAELRREFMPGSVYRISARAGAEDMASVFAAVGLEMSVADAQPQEGGYTLFKIKTPSRENMGEALIREFSARRGLRLRSLENAAPSLEDIFLAATRKSWEQNRSETEADFNKK
ncbi:MAG: ABC transporter ATP-binding protein [Opitutales bacterium]|nr:ABC transporter ATP-binding protein [Opitutales bacterium]